jgi:hypothetical protein
MGKAFMNRHRKSELPDRDTYNTPYSATKQLLEVEKFEGNVLEPASGNDAITHVLKSYFEEIITSDIKDGIDFLKYPENKYDGVYDNIVTNPPYSLADEFVLKAKELYTRKIAMFLRTNWLSGYQRYRKGVYEELARIWVFTRMMDLRAPLREDGKYPTAGIVYAWMIWEKGYIGNPTVGWIDNQKYVRRDN